MGHFYSSLLLQEKRKSLEEGDDDDKVEKGGFVREIKGKDDGLMMYVGGGGLLERENQERECLDENGGEKVEIHLQNWTVGA